MVKRGELVERTDAELVELTRQGADEAFGELWRRHFPAAVAVTRTFTGFEADDVVQEAFARVLLLVRSGHGPETAFRAYLIKAARNIASNMARSRASSELTAVDSQEFERRIPPLPDFADRVVMDQFIRGVFATLPARWQWALWYREIADLAVRDLAVLLGLSDNAATALLARARSGMRQAWLEADRDTPVARTLPPATGRDSERRPSYRG